MKRIPTFVMTVVALALGAGLLLLVIASAPGAKQAAPAPAEVGAPAAQDMASQAAAPAPDSLEGSYAGVVVLGAAVPYTLDQNFRTPVPPAGTPTPDYGDVQLGLLLRQSGQNVNGHVDLGVTLVFTKEHTIQATPVGYPTGTGVPPPGATPLAVGPVVSGMFDGTTLRLLSQETQFTSDTGDVVRRQFRMIGTLVAGADKTFRGEYRETFYRNGKDPITLVGQFELSSPAKPVQPDETFTPTPTATSIGGPTSTPTSRPPGDHALYLPLLQR